MHGGSNEDPETGIVYMGTWIWTSAIGQDLASWTLVTDERLKDNIDDIVFFVHKGVRHKISYSN